MTPTSIKQVQDLIDDSIERISEKALYEVLYRHAKLPDADVAGLECEKQCMFFRLEDGTVNHRAYNDEEGKSPYPAYDSWDEKVYSYLIDRAESVTHDKLIARYNQILFNAPQHKTTGAGTRRY